MLLTGAEILIKSLIDEGVDTIFGYPGGAILNVYDEFYRYQDRIRHVLTSHEQGAAHAADLMWYICRVFGLPLPLKVAIVLRILLLTTGGWALINGINRICPELAKAIRERR